MPRIRHECNGQGCFLKNRHPKWEVFDECFPGKAAISNVDGMVVHGDEEISDGPAAADVSGTLLIVEWKTARMALSVGQKRLIEGLRAESTTWAS